jgi:uncharacterized protein with FMN-binding domain
MKRALIVGTGTVMGVAAVLALNPDGTIATPAASAATSSSSGTTAGSSSSGSSSSGSSSSGSSSSGSSSSGSSSGSSSSGSSSSTSGTFTGSTVDVGHGYGSIAVEVTVTDGRIVDITALEVPQNDHRSAMISQMAFPTLKQQAIAAQSADISGVSGASYTSTGFAESLRDALTQAGLA